MTDEIKKDESTSTKVQGDDVWAELEKEVAEEDKAKTETKDETKVETSQEQTTEEHPTVKGRKAWEFVNEKMDSLDKKLDDFIKASERTPAAAPVPVGDLWDQLNAVEPCPVDPDTPLNAREQIQLDQWKTRTQTVLQNRARQDYANAYLGKMNKLSSEGGDLHARVVHMITAEDSPYNRYGTGTGEIDAELNYMRALKSLLKETKGGQVDTKSKSDGTGVTVDTAKDTTAVVAPKLEPDAEEYANYLGMSAADRADAMKRPLVGLGKV